jgi:CRP-like cAMP-binding protein
MSQSEWMSECPADFRDAVFRACQLRHFAAGEVLYRYGDPAGAIFGIVAGAVQIAVPADDGQETVIHRDEQGFWLGDLAMLSDRTRLVTVTASEPVRALCLPAARVVEMVEATPAFFQPFYALPMPTYAPRCGSSPTSP